MGLFDSIKKLFSPIPKAEDKAIAVVSPKKNKKDLHLEALILTVSFNRNSVACPQFT